MTSLTDTTDLGIGAHPDDLEIMAAGPIVECRAHRDRWFSAVVCTDGRRGPRAGRYADLDDAALAALRRDEQTAAADLGGYAALVQLGYRSEDVLAGAEALVDELASILDAAGADIVYTHEPGDAHDTHVAVCAAVVQACRRLARARRPRRLLGCEGWRSLDRPDAGTRADIEWVAAVELERALLAAHATQVDEGPVDLDAELARRATGPSRHRTRAVDLTALVSE
ncbi:MAG: PIG-L deacetylase family protein [Acidimicrobiia bacterium]